jgi:phosphomannomutase
MKTGVQELMDRTGVKFGTSGARGLAERMTDQVCYAYTQGFLRYLESVGELKQPGTEVAVAGDLRPSTNRIMSAVLQAAFDLGYTPVNCGKVPSPAVALFGFKRGIPSIMVTGSHIPADRNGIKFNRCASEVLKPDEAGIRAQAIDLPDGLFDADGRFTAGIRTQTTVRPDAGEEYLARYLDLFPAGVLEGSRIGVYEHSAVGRDLLGEIIGRLGAEVTRLGRSDVFVPVDTEAIRDEDKALGRAWAGAYRFDAIVSTDGDSDRPLIADERGEWFRGDIAGILCARFLEADSVSTPVSSNTAVERCCWFPEVRRTRIGSPFVIASMREATARGARRAVGYEANGGFLIDSDLVVGRHTLRALPTRDALILLLGLLVMARRRSQTLSALAAELPPRFTASGLLKETSPEQSAAVLARFDTGDPVTDQAAIEGVFGLGRVTAIDRTDGVRITFETGDLIHLRPSGNAPEFRCYAEAGSAARVEQILAMGLSTVRGLFV